MKNTPFFLALALLTSVGCSTATAPTFNNGEQLDADVPLAGVDPRTWLISLAGGGMLRGLTIDEEGTLLNTGTLTLSAPYLADTPQLELERVVGGGFIASTVGDNQPLQAFSLVPTVYPIEERGVWTVGANQNIDRADAVLVSNVASRWGVVAPVTVMGDYHARLAELTCGQ